MAKLKQSSKKDRKRKSGCNLAYKAENRHEKSHIRRIKKHISRYGKTDKTAADALLNFATKCGLSPLNSAKEFLKSA